MGDKTATCATCAHWGKPDGDYSFPQIVSAPCNAAKDRREIIDEAIGRAGLSCDDEWNETEAYKKAAIEALLDEPLILNSAYGNGFETQPHFGCTRHTRTGETK